MHEMPNDMYRDSGNVLLFDFELDILLIHNILIS